MLVYVSFGEKKKTKFTAIAAKKNFLMSKFKFNFFITLSLK